MCRLRLDRTADSQECGAPRVSKTLPDSDENARLTRYCLALFKGTFVCFFKLES